MPSSEGPLSQAARHVMEAEQRVARQSRLLHELERDGHSRLATEARKVLQTLQRTLELSRNHLRLEQEYAGKRPAKPE
ncbi:MAG TPA: hypothetical protein VFN42_01105 [Acetobacteraceae bacterium]|nr:hypothetical protein [Acetobacteraceae bacterium]